MKPDKKPKPEYCEWTVSPINVDFAKPGCKKHNVMDDNFKYCPFCGRKIKRM